MVENFDKMLKQVLLKVLDAVRKDERNESSRKKEQFQHRRLFIVLEGCMMDKGDKAFEVT